MARTTLRVWTKVPISPVAIHRAPRDRGSSDEDRFLGDFFFFATIFVLAGFFFATGFFTTAFFATALAAFRPFGRLRKAARWAAASAARAQSANSSESSNRRAGNCQYELTVTVFGSGLILKRL